ncbi:MAG: ABC-F family ATP-binding cassette domain-containing protein [Bdellovibrionaceae bacterium]|nr:ABC-F family ATP-binding cassette domain-containing protein [Pseudobdellovibrionaceae bacterium]
MLTLNRIGHEVAGRSLFKNISANLGEGVSGLVGPNGVGKTTLAKILAGEVMPTEGRVISQGRVIILAQKAERGGETLGEYLADVWEPPETVASLIQDLIAPLNLERRLVELSGGEWVRARLAKALAVGPAYLILDEPTNDLDREGRDLVLRFVREAPMGLLIISHDREVLAEVDRIYELSNQGLSLYGGDFEFYEGARAHERAGAESNLEKLKAAEKTAAREREDKIQRQEKRQRVAAAKAEDSGIPKILLGARKRRAQKTMSKIEVRESQNVRAAESAVDGAWGELKTDPFLRLDFEGARVPAGKVLAAAEAFNFRFNGAQRTLWPEPLTFQISGPSRWQLSGANGTGKSTLLKLLLGQRVPGDSAGRLELRAKDVCSLDQRYGDLNPELSVLQNVQENSRFAEVELRNELAFYGFTGEQVFQKVRALSGGETLKASLARMFLGARIPELIVLDEPTNNLDLAGLRLLEKALRDFKGAILLVSHDRAFADELGITDRLELRKA